MIDRVNLNRLINQALEQERRIDRGERVERSQSPPENRDVVRISEEARRALQANYEDLSQKVGQIKSQIAKGDYEVNTDKIIEGLRKFFP